MSNYLVLSSRCKYFRYPRYHFLCMLILNFLTLHSFLMTSLTDASLPQVALNWRLMCSDPEIISRYIRITCLLKMNE